MNKKGILEKIWPDIEKYLPKGPYSDDISDQKNRLFMEAILWLADSDGNWQDLPDDYGNKSAVYQKFNRWTKSGVWDRIFPMLHDHKDFPFSFDGKKIGMDLSNPKGGLRLTRRIYRRSRQYR